MVTMKEKNEKELAQHNAEMKELVRIIDHERKLREFMNRKVRICFNGHVLFDTVDS